MLLEPSSSLLNRSTNNRASRYSREREWAVAGIQAVLAGAVARRWPVWEYMQPRYNPGRPIPDRSLDPGRLQKHRRPCGASAPWWWFLPRARAPLPALSCREPEPDLRWLDRPDPVSSPLPFDLVAVRSGPSDLEIFCTRRCLTRGQSRKQQEL